MYPDAEFEGPEATAEEGFFSDVPVTREKGFQSCPCPLVAVGITGRAGKWLDAVGLICAELDPKKAIRAVGRVHVPTMKAKGRVEVPGAASPAVRPICDQAKEARARNSPAAAGLEQKCSAQTNLHVPDLAARGAIIVDTNPLAAELRAQQPDEPSRHGFDIGLAAAEGHTAPGPGKQAIHDSLSGDEQAGYDAGVLFSIIRNKNLDLLEKGAAVA